MEPKTEAAFRQHAVDDFPREACGLIVVVKGKERYLPCRNIAEADSDNFVMEPADFAAAEDLGDIIGVAHSHPSGINVPSECDKVMCSAPNGPLVPWHIVAVNAQGDTSDIRTIEPSGYVAPLVGRQFAHAVLDCYTLVRDCYQRELGIELPDFHRDEHWWNKGDDLYMQHFRDAGFEPIKGHVKKWDVIIMQVRSPVANHAGVYIGDDTILHHVYGRLSTREVYGGGYWQEVTRIIVRHKDVTDEQR